MKNMVLALMLAASVATAIKTGEAVKSPYGPQVQESTPAPKQLPFAPQKYRVMNDYSVFCPACPICPPLCP